jgi:glycerophosphoryl diester phosphodiesterase
MWYWYIIGAVVVLAVLYLAAICPRLKRPDMKALYGVYYAHRGLHDNKTDAPENSMAAFEKAVQGGYGIEFDVQLTKDRVPVVFHDETLLRVCGVDRKVRDCTWDELQQYRLCGSDATIPLLSDVLALVNGQVPLIIEIKAHESPAEVCRWSDPLIAAYNGPYCVESFDPRIIVWYRKNRPEVIRGQLSSCFHKPEKRESPVQTIVHYLLMNFMAKPDFIAYDHQHKHNLSRVLACRLFGALSVAWTIRSQQELDAARDAFALFIFEGFLPEP